MGAFLEGTSMPIDRNIRKNAGFYAIYGRLFGIAITVCAIGALPAFSSYASAHPGGLAADGCHNDRKNGGRHCHRANREHSPPAPLRATSGKVHYQNCDAVRQAGAAPVRRGQPGYARHLDRDNDGIGCE